MESSCIPDFPDSPDPAVSPVPAIVLGFRLRVELNDTQPPVWRSMVVPGNSHLDTLHALLPTVRSRKLGEDPAAWARLMSEELEPAHTIVAALVRSAVLDLERV